MAPAETILHDLRFGLRVLLLSRWSTAVTILSLAIGIGVNTAAITAYQAFFARSLDARDAHEMVNIAIQRNSGADTLFNYHDYETYRNSIRGFSGLIAYRMARVTLSDAGRMISQRTAQNESAAGRYLGMTVPSAGNAEFAQVAVVSQNYFSVMGTAAIYGRTFEMNSAGASTTPAVLVSENYWQRRFAGDPSILGKTIRLNGVAVTVSGVTPHDFVGNGVATPAFWLPLSIEPLINGNSRWLREPEKRYRIYGRLASGVTIAQATAEVAAVAEHLWSQQNSATDPAALAEKPATVWVWPGSPFPLPLDQMIGVNLVVGLVMFGAAMVLLVACANVGSLQLARARSREMELRTRLSLGATRGRLIRQLLTENALMGLMAGGLALLICWVLLKAAVAAATDIMPVQYGSLVFDVSPNLTVFVFVSLISLLAGVLAGLTPALQSPQSPLTTIGRGGTTTVRSRRLQSVLVAAQVALSLMLMIVGSMFVRGAMNSLSRETGYDAERVVHLEFHFPGDSQYTPVRRAALLNEVRRQVAALPGVTQVTSARPPGSLFRTAAIPVDVDQGAAPAAQSMIRYTYAQTGYFQTLGIPLLFGRGFERGSAEDEVVILSESAARQIFGGRNPLGGTLRLGLTDERAHRNADMAANGPVLQVIGVVRDTSGWSFDGSDSSQVYLPLREDSLDDRPLLVRTEVSTAETILAIERTVASLDAGLVVTTSTLEDALRNSPPFAGSSIGAAISSGIGMLGLLLALVGIFGTVSHIVARRTREVGIRMAIGAQKGDVLRLVLREIARPVLAGLTVGMALAFVVVYALRGILYGIAAVDGIYFVAIASAFFVIAILASYPPARRAMQVDPVNALRQE